MSKEDYSLKEFEDWLRNKTIMVCAFKEPINPFEITSTYIEEFKESKETPRYSVRYEGDEDTAFHFWAVIDTNISGKANEVATFYIEENTHDAEREAYYYAEYLNNREDD